VLTEFRFDILKVKDYLGNLDNIKYDVKRVGCRLNSFASEWGLVTSCCDYGNET
jgi:hypothetical protein